MPSFRRASSKADHRMFYCKRCKALVFLCRACDRRHLYCSSECAEATRHEQRKVAARWRSSTPEGRRKNAERQRRWRERQRQRRSEALRQEGVTRLQAPQADPRAPRPLALTKWPRPDKAPPASSRFEPLDRDKNGYRCNFCGVRSCIRSSWREVWPGPSRWRP